ncbi:hypothetical protein [Shouchella shacheensis]|uniref:hypothetical protein n=1 Tax=Shouchella shacheensis TaxID=1649580 RepID=UPI00073FB6EF|nr:hypothetical protein [Shouchella shacheensis]
MYNYQRNGSMFEQCQQYTNYPVKLDTHEGHHWEGIIEYVDQENVYLLIPVDMQEQPMSLTQLKHEYESFEGGDKRYYPGYGGYGYPYPPPYRPRPYGWRRLALPLAGLTALALLA